jgi:hypothetical protein
MSPPRRRGYAGGPTPWGRLRTRPEEGRKGTPRTRQSPLTLAAFRPWGSSQDGRRAGSGAQCTGRGTDPRRGGVGGLHLAVATSRTCTLSRGGLAERPKAHDWKSCWANTLTGSNPVSSAALESDDAGRPIAVRPAFVRRAPASSARAPTPIALDRHRREGQVPVGVHRERPRPRVEPGLVVLVRVRFPTMPPAGPASRHGRHRGPPPARAPAARSRRSTGRPPGRAACRPAGSAVDAGRVGCCAAQRRW